MFSKQIKATYLAAILAVVPAMGISQSQPEISLLAGQSSQTGYLWTSSFQRADGATCAWVRVEEGAMTRVLYDPNGGQCRRIPDDSADSFEFAGVKGDMLQFGGPDFTVVKNSASMVSGDWNHTSRDRRFDLQNVVFRFLPDSTE